MSAKKAVPQPGSEVRSVLSSRFGLMASLLMLPPLVGGWFFMQTLLADQNDVTPSAATEPAAKEKDAPRSVLDILKPQAPKSARIVTKPVPQHVTPPDRESVVAQQSNAGRPVVVTIEVEPEGRSRAAIPAPVKKGSPKETKDVPKAPPGPGPVPLPAVKVVSRPLPAIVDRKETVAPLPTLETTVGFIDDAPVKPIVEPKVEVVAPVPSPVKPIVEPKVEVAAPVPLPVKPIVEPKGGLAAPVPLPVTPLVEPNKVEVAAPVPLPVTPPMVEPRGEVAAPVPLPVQPIAAPTVEVAPVVPAPLPEVLPQRVNPLPRLDEEPVGVLVQKTPPSLPAPVPQPVKPLFQPPQPLPVAPVAPEKTPMPTPKASAGPPEATPRPAGKDLDEAGRYIKGFLDPNNKLELIQGRARLMMLKEAPQRIQVSDESIVAYSLLGAKDITLLGKTTGTTVLNLWFASADDKSRETVLSYLVRVLPDSEVKNRVQRGYQELEAEINRTFPDSVVRLKLVGAKVVVTGQAHDIEQATQILRLVVANTPEGTKTPANAAPTPRPDLNNAQPETCIDSGSPNVINMMRVAGVQQVMLKVIVAEVNRTAARSLGLNFSRCAGQGGHGCENNAGLDNGQSALALNALKRLSYAKALAEPNLVTLNGQTATFDAGGSFPVPSVTGNGAGGLQGVSFVPFGVKLAFTPYITDRDRIRLNVTATVSTRETNIGTTVGNSAVPGLNSRNFSSTIELREGQTLAVAGLIQSNLAAQRDQPLLGGGIPLLNCLTNHQRIAAEEKELVVLITPELVQPLKHGQHPPLPGSDLFEPSDLEFYLLGRLEGRHTMDFRSPVMTDCQRIQRFNRCEQIYIFGPTGYRTTPALSH